MLSRFWCEQKRMEVNLQVRGFRAKLLIWDVNIDYGWIIK